MRKLIGFFAGIIIIALVAVLVATTIRVYNYSEQSRVDMVLFQPAETYQNRIDAPIPLDRYPDERIRNHLIVKFATEYLQVFPSKDELDSRAGGALGMMSSPDVLAKWRRDILPGLEDMAAKRQMQRIIVQARDISKPGDYFVVPFSRKVWNNPNDLTNGPVVSGGEEMHIKLRFEKKVWATRNGREFDAGRHLDRGLPPPAIFKFMVEEVIIR